MIGLKKLLIVFDALSSYGLSMPVSASMAHCENVKIENVLTGPRHKAMIKVNDSSCGNNGFFCFHSSHPSIDEPLMKLMFAFSLSHQAAGKAISIWSSSAEIGCGGAFPIIDDIRTYH